MFSYGLWSIVPIFESYIGNTIDGFLKQCEKSKCQIVYFHNLKFDGTFLVSYCLEFLHIVPEVLLSNNQWFSVRIKNIEFRDSLKKFKMSVFGLGKYLGIPTKLNVEDETGKKPWDYLIDKKYVPSAKIIEYCVRDSEIVATGIGQEWDAKRTRLTASSEAYHNAINIIGRFDFKKLFPTLTEEMDTFFRSAYRGGVCAVNPKYQGKEVVNIYGYDVNGLYGWVMDECKLPYGLPYEGEPLSANDLYVVRFTCEFKVKDGYFPFLQLKGNSQYIGRETEYLKESAGLTELTLTSVDYEMFKKHYHIWNDYGYTYVSIKAKYNILSPVIRKNIEMKAFYSEPENYNPYKRGVAKDNTNHLYGSFALNPNADAPTPCLEDGKLTFHHEKIKRKARYIPMAVFITAYARKKTIEAIQANYDNWLYSDTDSMYLLNEARGIDIHPSKSGAWKFETWDGTPFKYGKFLRQKMYVLADENREIYQKIDKFGNYISELKCAGMPDTVKKQLKYEDVQLGITLSKLMHTVVPGGVCLVEHPYTITGRLENGQN